MLALLLAPAMDAEVDDAVADDAIADGAIADGAIAAESMESLETSDSMENAEISTMEGVENSGDVEGLQRWRQLLEEQFPASGWAGRLRMTDLTGLDGPRSYSQWSVTSKAWEASVVTERDPGERDWTDHLVGYVRWHPVQPKQQQIVVGDLRPGFAQGLLFGRGSGRSRGRPRRDASRLGVRSSSEGRTVRGAAATWGELWQWSLIGGRLSWDARFDKQGNVKSLPEDGIHTGPTAIAGREALGGSLLGLRLRRELSEPGVSGRQVSDPRIGDSRANRQRVTSKRASNRHIGLLLQHLRFDRSLLIPTKYGSDLFVGRDQSAVSVDGQWSRGSARFYTEIGATSRALAGMAGFGGLGPRAARVSVQARVYEPGFFSPLGSSGRRWQTANEHGVVVDMRGRGWRTWVDLAMRPEPASIPISDESREVGFERRWRTGPVQLRVDLRHRDDLGWSGGEQIDVRSKRLRLQGTLTRRLVRIRLSGQTLRTKETGARTGGANQTAGANETGANQNGRDTRDTGESIGIEARWRTTQVQAQLHLTLFRISAWAARIYEYEATLPGAVSILPLSGEGMRFNGSMHLRLHGWRLAMYARHERRRRRADRTHIGVQIDHMMPTKSIR